jgi:hypothetical protein
MKTSMALVSTMMRGRVAEAAGDADAARSGDGVDREG